MKVRVYTTERCPNCELLKKFLAAKGVRYEEVDMTTAEALTELRLHGVFTLTAPVLQVGEKFPSAHMRPPPPSQQTLRSFSRSYSRSSTPGMLEISFRGSSKILFCLPRKHGSW